MLSSLHPSRGFSVWGAFTHCPTVAWECGVASSLSCFELYPWDKSWSQTEVFHLTTSSAAHTCSRTWQCPLCQRITWIIMGTAEHIAQFSAIKLLLRNSLEANRSLIKQRTLMHWLNKLLCSQSHVEYSLKHVGSFILFKLTLYPLDSFTEQQENGRGAKGS